MQPVYLDESRDFAERARDLVSRMTLEEKVTQMVFTAPAIPRLGVPSYNWWNEALHGVARAGTATVFPQAIGLAATFDEELVHRVADAISTEARAKFHAAQEKGDHGIYKGLTFWSPNVNIFRDPRWGRGHETYGEDPYLTSRLGVAFVKGLQGDDPRYLKTAACAKHFAVHSGPEQGRHSFNAEVSQKDLYETYLPAFEACVREAGVEAVMGAYNRTNGEPCCGSKTLLNDILREKWGFSGHVTSDCWALRDFHEGHMVTHTMPESIAMALNSGCDLNCGNLYANLLVAYQEGLVTEEAIDRAVIRLMITRMKLGLFDKREHVGYNKIPYEANDCPEHRELNLEVARQTLVLLKNKNHTLPLKREKLRSIAVIGPNADSVAALEGNYYGTASRYITPLEGIADAVGETVRVYYSKGCHLCRDAESVHRDEADDRINEAVSVAELADVAVLCLGLDATIEGEEGDPSNPFASGDRRNLNLPGMQQELLERVCAVGKPVILVLMCGSALSVTWADEHVDAILQAWYPGAQGGRALASVLFGEASPSGRLPVTFYRTTEELPNFLDYSMQNRTYRYMKQDALYPFGFGLSYTEFSYSEIEASQTRLSPGEELSCRVLVNNIGNYDCMETVQLYIRENKAGDHLPNHSLRKIKRIMIPKGTQIEVAFTLTCDDFMVIDENGDKVLRDGCYTVFISGQQPDRRSAALTGRQSRFCEIEIIL